MCTGEHRRNKESADVSMRNACVRACSIGRIQISDPSNPLESTEHFVLVLDSCHVGEVIKWHSRVTQKGESRIRGARVVRKVNKSISSDVCAYHNVYKRSVGETRLSVVCARWIFRSSSGIGSHKIARYGAGGSINIVFLPRHRRTFTAHAAERL